MQVAIMVVLLAGAAYVVTSNVDDWGDWVVFGVVVLTVVGAALAIYPRMYARRKRTISRASASPPRRPPGPGPRA